ncbi:MAG: nuclear transport factor 2 family protein [Burkholderiales bacterium]|nr:nuclear transport factor 2 family protein [Burkholderiales bacterium]
MDRAKLIETAERYFAAVDAKDIGRVLAFFVPDAVFTIATYGTAYRGRDGEIRGMFERLFDRYAGIWHGDFDHVVAPPDRLACRFRVVNTAASGERWHKHNCNFFRARGELFDEVFVFMSGDNSLR